MTRKPRIKPPPVPAGEDPLITIGNQEKQIDMLLKRIETLTTQVDTYASDCRKAEGTSDTAWMELKTLQEDHDQLKSAFARLSGWQSCAREVIKSLVEK